MDNLEIYDKSREVPPEALRTIGAGRLKGKSDINPMWRLKKLTEIFGPCGIGWKYTIKREWLEAGAKGEIAAFVDIDLYYKWNGEWSEPIPGTGGSAFVTNETKGLYTSDECFKMALTDAISVSCKALGFAADVYWDKDKTKYSGKSQPGTSHVSQELGQAINKQIKILQAVWGMKDINSTVKRIEEYGVPVRNLPTEQQASEASQKLAQWIEEAKQMSGA